MNRWFHRENLMSAVEQKLLTPIIYVVDDDDAVRHAIATAGQLVGYTVRGYASAAEFLLEYDPEVPGCLVLDIRMPEVSGLELQKKLSDEGMEIPIIIISGHADVRTAVEVMTLGAVTLLEKPFQLDELTNYLNQAIAKDLQNRSSEAYDARTRLANLTSKEREVLELIAAGCTNKEMANKLGSASGRWKIAAAD